MSDVIPAISALEKIQFRSNPLPEFRVGDTVRVWVKIKEGDKERTQAFEGVVIARKNHGIRATFVVRKVSYSVGVERTFPVHSPWIESVEVINRGEVHQSKLYYLRDLKGKAARIKTVS